MMYLFQSESKEKEWSPAHNICLAEATEHLYKFEKSCPTPVTCVSTVFTVHHGGQGAEFVLNLQTCKNCPLLMQNSAAKLSSNMAYFSHATSKVDVICKYNNNAYRI